jgi:hypothetical protein
LAWVVSASRSNKEQDLIVSFVSCTLHRKNAKKGPLAAMVSLSMITFLFGAALGQLFKVVVLVPAMVIVILLSVGTGVTHAQNARWIVLTLHACNWATSLG